MRKAFYQDMRSKGGLVNLESEGKGQHNQNIERQRVQFQAQGEIGRMKGIGDGDDDHPSVPPRSSVHLTEGINPSSNQGIHRAGTATEMFIEDSLTHLTRLLTVVERLVWLKVMNRFNITGSFIRWVVPFDRVADVLPVVTERNKRTPQSQVFRLSFAGLRDAQNTLVCDCHRCLLFRPYGFVHVCMPWFVSGSSEGYRRKMFSTIVGIWLKCPCTLVSVCFPPYISRAFCGARIILSTVFFGRCGKLSRRGGLVRHTAPCTFCLLVLQSMYVVRLGYVTYEGDVSEFAVGGRVWKSRLGSRSNDARLCPHSLS